ncbi:thiamine-repressible mitochondrial transport protein THI74 [Sesamum indicum]|uniref:Thiamine-repressible mitochondrial transport protein THI74 n=1 Tax=Sesamum indicum TaxID=4182 RepID=A0A6I9T7R2_SESIN|nr:thiamine-repressible mitochondrial transport protein THI74 [Sesamum indicum]XP_020550832.1 thiamine-repressible mitochondrial transport protein THI74 [Sesamum indicum]
MKNQVWPWVLGLIYIFAVGAIWIAASFVVQSVVDGGVSPFLVTYICDSLFVLLIPLVEIVRYLEDNHGSWLFWRKREDTNLQESRAAEEKVLLEDYEAGAQAEGLKSDVIVLKNDIDHHKEGEAMSEQHRVPEYVGSWGLDAKGRWTRRRTAKVSLLICPFWFLAQLAFNLSLKYTSVTSNTILSSSSSLFTFLVALVFLGEKFTWLKLISVLLCMGGTIIVSLGDSKAGSNLVASNPVSGDILALASSAFYAVYTTLLRIKLPDDDDEVQGRVSMAQVLGFLGLFNLLLFLPVALILEFTKLENFHILSGRDLGLIVGKGLLDNVLSDYLWAKAVLLTTTTVATAGLSIQVPLAAIVDSLTGNAPHLLEYIGAAVVMVGFTVLNIPSGVLSRTTEASLELETSNKNANEHRDDL